MNQLQKYQKTWLYHQTAKKTIMTLWNQKLQLQNSKLRVIKLLEGVLSAIAVLTWKYAIQFIFHMIHIWYHLNLIKYLFLMSGFSCSRTPLLFEFCQQVSGNAKFIFLVIITMSSIIYVHHEFLASPQKTANKKSIVQEI